MIVANAAPVIPDFTTGYVYLLVVATVLVTFVTSLRLLNKKKVIPEIS